MKYIKIKNVEQLTKEDIKKYATPEEQKILLEYKPLYKKQENLLRKFIQKYNIRRTFFDIQKDTTLQMWEELQNIIAIHDTETSYQDVERFIADNPAPIKSRTAPQYENKVLKTKSPLLKEEILKEKWTDKLQNVYNDFEEFKDYDEMYGLAKRLGFDSAEEAWETNPIIEGSVDPQDYKRSGIDLPPYK